MAEGALLLPRGLDRELIRMQCRKCLSMLSDPGAQLGTGFFQGRLNVLITLCVSGTATVQRVDNSVWVGNGIVFPLVWIVYGPRSIVR